MSFKVTVQQPTDVVLIFRRRCRYVVGRFDARPWILASSHDGQHVDLACPIRMHDDRWWLEVIVGLAYSGRNQRWYAGDDTRGKCSGSTFARVLVVSQNRQNQILVRQVQPSGTNRGAIQIDSPALKAPYNNPCSSVRCEGRRHEPPVPVESRNRPLCCRRDGP
jgi:hypothetical protein